MSRGVLLPSWFNQWHRASVSSWHLQRCWLSSVYGLSRWTIWRRFWLDNATVQVILVPHPLRSTPNVCVSWRRSCSLLIAVMWCQSMPTLACPNQRVVSTWTVRQCYRPSVDAVYRRVPRGLRLSRGLHHLNGSGVWPRSVCRPGGCILLQLFCRLLRRVIRAHRPHVRRPVLQRLLWRRSWAHHRHMQVRRRCARAAIGKVVSLPFCRDLSVAASCTRAHPRRLCFSVSRASG